MCFLARVTVLSAALAALTVPAATVHAAPAGRVPGDVVTAPLQDALQALSVRDEDRTGYRRNSFRHWIDEDKDGCSTRAEVLIAESTTEPAIEPGCKVSSGTWYSYYDGQTVTAPGGLDIDHVVPLAEAWDSGASQWTAARRQAYANELGAERSLVAVTARTNRQKADQDPGQCLPPLADAVCLYAADWTATKLRWSLSVDRAEADALTVLAERCPGTEVEFESAEGE